MPSWSWNLDTDNDGLESWVEHDGRVTITIQSADVDDGRTVTVDPVDFEAMARSYLERMAEWRRRIDEVPS